MSTNIDTLNTQAIGLLKQLIATPSFSKEENETAEIICNFFGALNVEYARIGNNVYAKSKYYDASRPSVLLNSHHDTVKPNAKYTRNPFEPVEENGQLFGLGSNDAGGCLVSLIATFLYY